MYNLQEKKPPANYILCLKGRQKQDETFILHFDVNDSLLNSLKKHKTIVQTMFRACPQ